MPFFVELVIFYGMEDINKSKLELLHNELSQEVQLSRKFLVEIEKKWEKILCKNKFECLKSELEHLKSQLEQELCQKNEYIKKLQHRFDSAEDRRRNVASCHFHMMDDLVKAYDEEIVAMEKQFSMDVEKIATSFKREENMRQIHFEEEQMKLNELKQEIECERTVIVDMCSKDHQEAIEEIRNKYTDNKNNLRFVMDTRIEDLNEQFELVRSDFLQKTDSQSDSLKQQIRNDEMMTKDVVNLQMELDSLSKNLRSLQVVAKRKAMQNANRTEQLLQRKNDVLKKHRVAKERMDALMNVQHEKLKALTKSSNERKHDINSKLHATQRVINLIQLTNKLEISLNISIDYDRKSESANPIDRVLSKYNLLLLKAQNDCKVENQLLDQKTQLKTALNRITNRKKSGNIRCPDEMPLLLHSNDRLDLIAMKNY